MTKAAELREMDSDILEARLADAKSEMFNLRFQHATGQFDRTHRFGELKREVARILTILGERATAEAVQEEAEAAVEGERLSWRQRLRRRRQARRQMLGQAEQVAAGHAGEGVEIVAPTPEEEEEEAAPEDEDEGAVEAEIVDDEDEDTEAEAPAAEAAGEDSEDAGEQDELRSPRSEGGLGGVAVGEDSEDAGEQDELRSPQSEEEE